MNSHHRHLFDFLLLVAFDVHNQALVDYASKDKEWKKSKKLKHFFLCAWVFWISLKWYKNFFFSFSHSLKASFSFSVLFIQKQHKNFFFFHTKQNIYRRRKKKEKNCCWGRRRKIARKKIGCESHSRTNTIMLHWMKILLSSVFSCVLVKFSENKVIKIADLKWNFMKVG